MFNVKASVYIFSRHGERKFVLIFLTNLSQEQIVVVIDKAGIFRQLTLAPK